MRVSHHDYIFKYIYYMMMMMTMTPDTRVSVSNKVEIVRMGESKNRFIQKLLIPVTLGMCCGINQTICGEFGKFFIALSSLGRAIAFVLRPKDFLPLCKFAFNSGLLRLLCFLLWLSLLLRLPPSLPSQFSH